MKLTLTIAVFTKVHRSGITVDGPAEIMEFDEDRLLDMLRRASSHPIDHQRHWQIEKIEFK